MVDVNMRFVAESFDAIIWNQVGELGEDLGLCCLFSSLNLKSCVMTPVPDWQHTCSRKEVDADMLSGSVMNLWTVITFPLRREQEEWDMQWGTFSGAHYFFSKELNTQDIKSSKLETHFVHFFISRLEYSVCSHLCWWCNNSIKY